MPKLWPIPFLALAAAAWTATAQAQTAQAGSSEVSRSASACQDWKASEIVLERPFARQGRYGYLASVPSLEGTSDSMETPQRSRALLCENGKLIGTAHSQHADIRDKGAGLFSHWRNEVLFSSSDNSDPNTNGRTYSLVQPTR
jgi:hypothetical protein